MEPIKFISIGEACDVKHQIDNCIGESETLFFDWLKTSFLTVIEVLEDGFDPDKIKIIETGRKNGHARICNVEPYDFFEVNHDIGLNENDNYVTFKLRYLRRYKRMIDIIKNCDDVLVFIHKGSIKTFADYIKFINAVIDHRGYDDFWFVNISEGSSQFIHKNYLSFDINDYMIGNIDRSDWKSMYINWLEIFNQIKLKVDIKNDTKKSY